MRGAGCIINDMWDKDYDARVGILYQSSYQLPVILFLCGRSALARLDYQQIKQLFSIIYLLIKTNYSELDNF